MNIAVLGYGVVGSAVVKRIETDQQHSLVAVLVLPSQVDRHPKAIDDYSRILNNPDIDIVIEVLNGVYPAYDYVSLALKAGKHVISSNKSLLIAKGLELNNLAYENRCGLRFSAACGGGIPILPELYKHKSEGLININAILNGTTNYILDQMETELSQFNDALSQAKALGYAEQDPSDDLNGKDSGRKLILALAVSQEKWIYETDILREGIDSLEATDFEMFKQLNMICRLNAQIEINEDALSISVLPTLLKPSSFQATFHRNENGILFKTKKDSYYLRGYGAGGEPTSLNIINDIKSIADHEYHLFPIQLNPVKINTHTILKRFYIQSNQALSEIKTISHRHWHSKTYFYLTNPSDLKSILTQVSKYRSLGIHISLCAIEGEL